MMTQADVLKLVSGLSRQDLELWVNQGWVRPPRRMETYVFREIDIARVRLIYEMQTDLNISEEAIPPLLSLIDQVYGLRRELKSLAKAVQKERFDVRQRIATQVTILRSQSTQGEE